MVTTEDIEPGTGYWSRYGSNGRHQPDNSGHQGNDPATMENCVAVLNNWFEDGVSFHDQRCMNKHPALCEDAEDMLNFNSMAGL